MRTLSPRADAPTVDQRCDAPMAVPMSVEECALRQNLMREVNERIHQLRWARSEGETMGYLCECNLADCWETVTLGADAYDAVRASPLRFVLLPGHECLAVEDVVERHPDYTVVENVGEAAEIARSADPRASPRTTDSGA